MYIGREGLTPLYLASVSLVNDNTVCGRSFVVVGTDASVSEVRVLCIVFEILEEETTALAGSDSSSSESELFESLRLMSAMPIHTRRIAPRVTRVYDIRKINLFQAITFRCNQKTPLRHCGRLHRRQMQRSILASIPFGIQALRYQ